ncbi:unnamed protein product, partial [Didymodactylos carnosus]
YSVCRGSSEDVESDELVVVNVDRRCILTEEFDAMRLLDRCSVCVNESGVPGLKSGKTVISE